MVVELKEIVAFQENTVLFVVNIVIFCANTVMFGENTVLFGANAMHSTGFEEQSATCEESVTWDGAE